MVTSTFVSATDQHLAASLRVGAVAGSLYPIIKNADLAHFPAEVQDELRAAHAALNRAAMKLIDISISNSETPPAVAHYTDLAAQAMGGAA